MQARRVTKEDKTIFCTMVSDFYTSNAVDHTINPENIQQTFLQAAEHNPTFEALLLEARGQVVGYALLPLYWSNEFGGNVLFLDELYIKPEYRGNGYGKQFFTMLEQEYSDRYKCIRLEVTPVNEGAIRLYRRLGFGDRPYLQMIRER